MPLTRSGTDVREFLLPSIFEASTISQVREIPRPVDKAHSIVGSTGVGLVYKFDSSSSAADDGYEILRPDDTTWSGRWLLIPLGAASGGDGIYNVKSFGATGDGVTDDQASIQSAIDEATTKEGGIVFFPSGDYLIKATLVLTPGVRLMGVSGQDNTTASGIGSTISSQTVATPSVSFTGDGTTNNSSSVEVASLRIIDTGGTPTTAITFTSARNCYVNGCYFQGFSEASVNLFSGEGNIVDRVMVGSSDAIGIKFSGLSKQSQLSNSKIEGCASASGAVEIIGTADGIRVLGNQITNNFGKGIYVSTPLSTTEHIAIENNLFDGNDATDTGDQDVYFIAATSHTNASIVGNQFTSVGTSTALKLESVSDSAIDNNSFAVANASITLDASSDNNILIGNKISGTTSDLGSGNQWDLGYDKSQINDRALSKAPSNGLYFDGTNDKVSLGSSALLSPGDGTDDSPLLFAANVQPDDVTNFPIYAKNAHGGSNSEFYFIFDAADKLALHLHDESAAVWVTRIQNAASVVDGQSVHVAAAYDGRGGANAADGITLYINGVVVASTATNDGAYDSMEDTSANAEVGTNEAGGTFAEGVIRSLLVFNREPTAAEILRLSINNVPEIVDQWGNANGGTYTSDFTSNSFDGFAFDSSNSPTADATATVGGDTDNVKFIAGSGTGTARMWKTVSATGGKRYRISFDYYMPSGQDYVDGFKTGINVNLTSGNYTDSATLATNAWTPFTTDLPSPLDPANFAFFIILKDGTSTTINGLAVGEYIAVRNIKVTEIGAVLSLNPDNIESDGDWIEASTNELNGTNTGATPLMVQPQTSGTFTPVLQFDGVSGSTYAASGQSGYWRMIDEKTVSLEIYIQITAVGIETGPATIGGLPFLSRVASDYTAQASIGGAGLLSLTGALHGLIRAYNTTIILSQTSATGDVGITHANFTATSYLQISAVYAIA